MAIPATWDSARRARAPRARNRLPGRCVRMIWAVPQDLDALPRRWRDHSSRGNRRGCPGGGRLVAARWPAFFLRVSVEPDVLLFYNNLWPGASPGPPNDIRAAPGGHPAWSVPGSASGAGRRGCRPRPPRPAPARRCRTARRPAGRRTGSPPPGSGARHPSGTPPPGTVRRMFFAPPRRRRSPGVRGGTAPRQPPQGTHGVWPRGTPHHLSTLLEAGL